MLIFGRCSKNSSETSFKFLYLIGTEVPPVAGSSNCVDNLFEQHTISTFHFYCCRKHITSPIFHGPYSFILIPTNIFHHTYSLWHTYIFHHSYSNRHIRSDIYHQPHSIIHQIHVPSDTYSIRHTTLDIFHQTYSISRIPSYIRCIFHQTYSLIYIFH